MNTEFDRTRLDIVLRGLIDVVETHYRRNRLRSICGGRCMREHMGAIARVVRDNVE